MKKFTNAIVLIVIAALLSCFSSCKKEEKNSNPVVSSVTVTPPSTEINSMVTVTVAATDSDGDALTYTYTVSGGAIAGNGASAMWTAPSQAGAFSVTVNVSDGNGGTASSNGALTVVQPPTQITGTASFPAGTSGDLSNSKVSIYTSIDNWYANQPIEFGSVTGSGASVTFTLANINPGNYYLDVWKDNDNDAGWSNGDFIGWFGSGGLGSPSLTEIQIAEGETKNVTISMYIIEGSTTILTGTASLDEGTVGDLANSQAALFASVNDFIDNNPVVTSAVTGNGNSVNYEFTDIAAGLYYLSVWKDNDNSNDYSPGDFLGWFGTGGTANPTLLPVDIVEGETFTANLVVYLIENIQQPTSITGTATMAAGGTGDLVNSKAYLYTSIDNWNNYISEYSVNTTGNGLSVDFALNGIAPGTYLLDVWKDSDNSGGWTPGDFIGLHGDIQTFTLYEITIQEGETLDFDITMYLLVEKEKGTISPSELRIINR